MEELILIGEEEIMTTLNDFIKEIKKVNKCRNHRVKNSYGITDGFKYYVNHVKDKGTYLDIGQYSKVIRKVNELLCQQFLKGYDIELPHRLGKIQLVKVKSKYEFDGDKIKTNQYVDWDATLKLWFEDNESKNKKLLVRHTVKEKFIITYNKKTANYKNQFFYAFRPTRGFKLLLKEAIRDDKIDAFI